MQCVCINHAWDEFFPIFDFAVTTPACLSAASLWQAGRQGRDFAGLLANSLTH
jgi:hypothetical protein